ncbi:hypothetical protein ABFA07_014167 [Porites harrisoni]
MIRSIGFRSALVFILFLSFIEAFTGPLQQGKRAGTNLTRTQCILCWKRIYLRGRNISHVTANGSNQQLPQTTHFRKHQNKVLKNGVKLQEQTRL